MNLAMMKNVLEQNGIPDTVVSVNGADLPGGVTLRQRVG